MSGYVMIGHVISGNYRLDEVNSSYIILGQVITGYVSLVQFR